MTGVLLAATMLLSQVSLEGRILTNANGAYLERGSEQIAVAPGIVVQPGDQLTTRGGTTTIRWGDNTIVYCGPQTTLSMAQESKLLLEAGEVRVVRRGPDGLQVRAKDVEVSIRQGIGRVRIDGADVRVRSERGDVVAQRLAQSGQRRSATPNRRFVSYLQQQANTLTEGTTRTFTADGGESTEDTNAGGELDPESVVMEGAGSQNQSLLSSFASNLASSTPPASMAVGSTPSGPQGTNTPETQGNETDSSTNYQLGTQNLAALNVSALASLGGSLSSISPAGSGTLGLGRAEPNDGTLISDFLGRINDVQTFLPSGTQLGNTDSIEFFTPTYLQQQNSYTVGAPNGLQFITSDGLPAVREYWSIANRLEDGSVPQQIIVKGGGTPQFGDSVPVSAAGLTQTMRDSDIITTPVPISFISIPGEPRQFLVRWDNMNTDSLNDIFDQTDVGFSELSFGRFTITGASPYLSADDETALDANATFGFGEFTVAYVEQSGKLEFATRSADAERLVDGPGNIREITLNPNVEYTELQSPNSSDDRFIRGERLVPKRTFSSLDRVQRAAFTTLMAETLHDFANRTGQTRFVIDGKIIDISGYRKQLPR